MRTKQKTSDIGEDLALLASKLAKDALNNEDDEWRLDVFKALTTYHVNLTRVQAKLPPEDEEEESSLVKFRERVSLASGGA